MAMLASGTSTCDEIVGVLQAELECAESIQATSAEVQSLIEAEKFEQVRERLMSRGETIDLMVSLDRQIKDLLENRQPGSETDDWNEIVKLAKKLHELVTSIMSLDRESQENLKKKGEEISKGLKTLLDGKKMLKAYGRPFREGHRMLYNG